jgi:hypothetical protein
MGIVTNLLQSPSEMGRLATLSPHTKAVCRQQVMFLLQRFYQLAQTRRREDRNAQDYMYCYYLYMNL